jgi:uncharacterized protein (DUF1499 family)
MRPLAAKRLGTLRRKRQDGLLLGSPGHNIINMKLIPRLKMWQIALLVPVVLVLAGVVFLAATSILSKKPTNLGVTDGRLAACPDSPNCVTSRTGDLEHEMPPWGYQCPDERVMPALKKIIAESPRAKVVTETDDYLHAEFTSQLFRFVDDVEFYIDKKNKVIHFRSASRAGHSDFGVNRKRMEELRRKFYDNTVPAG